jgi:hypothetical protein
MWVISPLVPKFRATWLAGERLPLPDTVDCTTPRATVTVRSRAVEVDGEPMARIATTTPAAASTPSAMVVRAGRRDISAHARRR